MTSARNAISSHPCERSRMIVGQLPRRRRVHVAAYLTRLGHEVVGFDRRDGDDLLDLAAVRRATAHGLNRGSPRASEQGSAPHAQGGRVRAGGALVKGTLAGHGTGRAPGDDRAGRPMAMPVVYRH